MTNINEIIGGIIKKPARFATEEEIRAYEWEKDVIPILETARLPKRFHYEITRWGNIEQKAAYKATKARLSMTGAIVALVGPRGTGKTTIAAQILIERARMGYACPGGWTTPYTKLTDLIAMFKPIYADFGSIDADRLAWKRDVFCSYGLRIIDELHECDEIKLKDRVLTDILDRCYSAKVDTIIISNEKREGFNESTNDSILSRIAEHGTIIPCEWPSYRQPNVEGMQ